MSRRKSRRPQRRETFTLLDEMMASNLEPMAPAFRQAQLTRMWASLASIERGQNPESFDWRCVVDAVNLTETLVRDMRIAEDTQGLLDDAVAALAAAAERYKQGRPLRLDAAGITAVRAILEDYSTLLEAITARTFIRAFRLTERRVRDILAGRGREHDVRITDLP